MFCKALDVSLILISPPSLCEITTLLLASTVATMFVKPLALIASAIRSASEVAPVAVNATVWCAFIASCPTMLSAIVNVLAPAAIELAVTAEDVIVVAPVAFLANNVKSPSSSPAKVVLT